MDLGDSDSKKIIYNDFPPLYRAADKASLAAQKQFVNLTSLYLSLMLCAAISGSLILSDISIKTTIAIVSAVLLTAGIFVTIIIRITKLEKVWYDGRAIAESVKTLSWRYMTGSEPFSLETSPKADEAFLSSLHSLFKERNEFAANLSIEYDRGNQITEKMRTVRELNIDERKMVYLSDRIEDQYKWYQEKAKNNLASGNRVFILTLMAQGLAIIFAFIYVLWPGMPFKLTAVFTTLATSFTAWTQMRRNEELSQSYGLATQELSFIYDQASQVKNDKELSVYVLNSENAISREHTMWQARRS
jgi:hypothetical protein